MEKPRVTPKDFFLWTGAMVSLYASVVAFISLFFSYVNYAFPDPLEYFPSDPYQSGVSYQMASLIVLYPLLLFLTWLIRRDISKDKSRAATWVRRWALMLTLFLAGAAIAVDLITLIMYFFNGEFSLRFALKVVLVLLVAAAGLMHFLADIWGYWSQFPERQRSVAYATSALVIATIIAGFFILGTPWQARLYRFDEQKVSDLQQIQSEVVNYYQTKQRLPTSLQDLQDPLSGFVLPVDPQSGQQFVYQMTGPLSFHLCAAFNAETRRYSLSTAVPRAPALYADAASDVWYHDAGKQCFFRTIDPTQYQPLSKQPAP